MGDDQERLFGLRPLPALSGEHRREGEHATHRRPHAPGIVALALIVAVNLVLKWCGHRAYPG